MDQFAASRGTPKADRIRFSISALNVRLKFHFRKKQFSGCRGLLIDSDHIVGRDPTHLRQGLTPQQFDGRPQLPKLQESLPTGRREAEGRR